MGDRLLRTVADILRKACRKNDLIARVGGDEFAILLPRTDAAMAGKIKQRILRTASKTKLDTIVVSLAVGFSVKTSFRDSIESVLRNADKLMYRRSSAGENGAEPDNRYCAQEHQFQIRAGANTYRESLAILLLIAGALKWSADKKSEMKIAGLLHDIGKIILPARLLNKAEKLTDEGIRHYKNTRGNKLSNIAIRGRIYHDSRIHFTSP